MHVVVRMLLKTLSLRQLEDRSPQRVCGNVVALGSIACLGRNYLGAIAALSVGPSILNRALVES